MDLLGAKVKPRTQDYQCVTGTFTGTISFLFSKVIFRFRSLWNELRTYSLGTEPSLTIILQTPLGQIVYKTAAF